MAVRDECEEWKRIAIEERAQRIISMEPEAKFDRYDLQECPQICYICDENDGYCVLSECPSKTFWKQIAAKELNLRVTQEAGYVDRLKKKFLDHLAARIYYESIPDVSDYWSWHDYPEEPCQMKPKQWFRDQAQSALTKIREGK